MKNINTNQRVVNRLLHAHVLKVHTLCFLFLLAIGMQPLSSQTMTFDAGASESGFTFSGWDACCNYIFPSNASINGEEFITKTSGTWNLVSFQSIPFGGANSTWRLSSDIGVTYDFIANSGGTVTHTPPGFTGVTWVKFKRTNSAPNGGNNDAWSLDNVVYSTGGPAAASVTMAFAPGDVDNCSNPLPNAGTYTATGTFNGKNVYTKGEFLRIRWENNRWEVQADDNTISGVNFFTLWYHTANTAIPPASCWTSAFGCFIPTFSGDVAPVVNLSSSTFNPAAGNVPGSGTLNYTLTFPSAVTGLTTSNFTINKDATITSATVSSVTAGAGNTWTVTVNGIVGYGDISVNLANETGASVVFCGSLPLESGTVSIPQPCSAPSITCPSNVAVNTTSGQCVGAASWTAPTPTGTCSPTASSSHVIGSNFSIGTTTVTYTATNSASQTGTCAFTVTVSDAQAPSITCPSNVAVNTATGTCANTATWTVPTPTDNCSGASIQSVSTASGSSFDIGATTVTYTAVDVAGKTKSCSFTVTVSDAQSPSITCPSNVAVNTATGTCANTATWTVPTPTDNCSGASIQSVSAASGSSFGVGTTTVTYTAVDVAGNTRTCSFTVIVSDAQAPSITCPSNVAVNTATGTCANTATWIVPTPTDNCSGASIQSVSAASGSSFDKGTTTVTYTAIDVASNTKTCSFTVTVSDAQAPSITCPANIMINNNAGSCQGTANWATPTPTDNCSGASIQGVSAASGSLFNEGITTVTYTAVDAAMNTNTCTFTVKVTVTVCPPMTGLTITNITATSAYVTWNTLPCATKYRPSYRRVTTTTAIWVYSEVSTGSTTITGLLSNTQYGVRVRSVCTGNISGALTAEKKFTTLSPMLGINNDAPEAVEQTKGSVEPSISIYPNPSNGRFNLDIADMADQPISVVVSDNSGRTAMAWRTNVQNSRLFEPFDLSDLPAGLYILRLKLDDGSTIIRTVIKN